MRGIVMHAYAEENNETDDLIQRLLMSFHIISITLLI